MLCRRDTATADCLVQETSGKNLSTMKMARAYELVILRNTYFSRLRKPTAKSRTLTNIWTEIFGVIVETRADLVAAS